MLHIVQYVNSKPFTLNKAGKHTIPMNKCILKKEINKIFMDYCHIKSNFLHIPPWMQYIFFGLHAIT